MKSIGANVVTPYEVGLAGSPDESWLDAIGKQRWVALMRDQNIRRRPLERRALAAARVAAFVCIAGEATAEETALAVTSLLQKMANIAFSEHRPFIYTFGLGGSMRQIPRRELL